MAYDNVCHICLFYLHLNDSNDFDQRGRIANWWLRYNKMHYVVMTFEARRPPMKKDNQFTHIFYDV